MKPLKVGNLMAIAMVFAGVITLFFQAPRLMAAQARAPRSGGELVFAVGGTPPSFDGHRETTFAMLHPVAPHYSTLLRFDPQSYPKIIGDVAESWSISKDALTYTFKIRRNINFHDGSKLTSKDVRATYEKIIFPPKGVPSARGASYANVDKIETPDVYTVVFHLKQPSASFLANLASPWNFIYKADILEKDPRWYEKNIMGSGPFSFVEYVPGSHWVGKKNPDYYMKGRPYLDGFKAIFIRDTAPRVAAIRSGQALIEFRGFNPAARDDIMKSLGNKGVVQDSPWICNLTVTINNEKKPFDDPRVRRALSLAIDRRLGSTALAKISLEKFVGGVFRPGSEFAASDAELSKLTGFGRNIEAARKEARRLLKEAGVPDGFSFTLKNRNVKEPYEVTGVFVIDQWRQIGLNVTHIQQEGGPYFNDFRQGNYDTGIDFACDFMDEPDLQLIKFISSDKSSLNYSRYKDSVLDDLYEKQSQETDPKKRLALLRQFEKRVLDEKAYQFHILWWQRIIPHWAKVKGWKVTPSHYLNQDLRDVWLAE
ncbi:MAG: ABC transporter substrate-binding protein [Deltaproteobacteria bacterium]|nr:ABC transporter substrate-binding protein [Deltaproteobacteria bacterium]MDZ4346750.1 ABC transporter substrate-binding protein [Candidatus Binatia bacterium]